MFRLPSVYYWIMETFCKLNAGFTCGGIVIGSICAYRLLYTSEYSCHYRSHCSQQPNSFLLISFQRPNDYVSSIGRDVSTGGLYCLSYETFGRIIWQSMEIHFQNGHIRFAHGGMKSDFSPHRWHEITGRFRQLAVSRGNEMECRSCRYLLLFCVRKTFSTFNSIIQSHAHFKVLAK